MQGRAALDEALAFEVHAETLEQAHGRAVRRVDARCDARKRQGEEAVREHRARCLAGEARSLAERVESVEQLDLASAAATLGALLKYREDADRVKAALDRMLSR